MDATTAALVLLAVLVLLSTLIGVGVWFYLDAQDSRRRRQQSHLGLRDNHYYAEPQRMLPSSTSARALPSPDPVKDRRIVIGEMNPVPIERRNIPDQRIQFGDTGQMPTKESGPRLNLGELDASARVCLLCRRPIDATQHIVTCSRGHGFHQHCWSEHTHENARSCPLCDSPAVQRRTV